MASQSFRDLLVWQAAHKLVLRIYRMSRNFPDHERYALTSQIRRASASVAANIVEGYRRRTAKEKIKFYNNALASLDETKYFLILAEDLEYSDSKEVLQSAEEVAKMLYSYSRAIKKNPIDGAV